MYLFNDLIYQLKYFYSDDWKEVLVSESEYYTNDILLRSPTLRPYLMY